MPMNLYFNEELHKYTDDLKRPYISTTTLIGKYAEKFNSADIAVACANIGTNPKHPKYLKYKGKTVEQLLEEWDKARIDGCEKGTIKHNYFEDFIKKRNNFDAVKDEFSKPKLYTIVDVLNNPDVGQIDSTDIIELSIKYPSIYRAISKFLDRGFSIYSEVGVCNTDYLVSGLIDIILIKGNTFFILDWKTNNAPIRYEAGYYDKDNNGKITDKFIIKDETLLAPITHLPASVGHKYSLQVSGYAQQVIDLTGMKWIGSSICHIRTLPNEQEEVKFVSVLDLRNEFVTIGKHYYNNVLSKTLN